MKPQKLFEITGRIVSIMGLKGFVDGNDYTIDINFGTAQNPSYVLAQCSKPEQTILSKIEQLIADDKKAGNEEKIDHILISNRYAVLLFLEGKITREVLESGTVSDGDLVINLYVGGAMRKVVIQAETKSAYHCATIDVNGEVV